MTFATITLAFFLFLAFISARGERYIRDERIRLRDTRPLNHKALMILRVIAGVIYFSFIVFVAKDWFSLILIPSSAAAFAMFHRNIFNGSERPGYLGVDSSYDRYWLRRVGLIFTYRSSLHYERYKQWSSYRLKVQKAANEAQGAELIVIITFDIIYLVAKVCQA